MEVIRTNCNVASQVVCSSQYPIVPKTIVKATVIIPSVGIRRSDVLIPDFEYPLILAWLSVLLKQLLIVLWSNGKTLSMVVLGNGKWINLLHATEPESEFSKKRSGRPDG